MPAWIVDAVVVATRVLAAIVFVGLLAWALYGRRWRMLGTVALAGLVAAAVVTMLESGIDADEGSALVEVGVDLDPLTASGFPSTAGIAAIAAALTAAAPWLDRRARRAGWALMLGLMVTAFVDSPLSFDALRAGIGGWLVGAAVLVAVGAPSRRPRQQAVVEGLVAVGIDLRELERAGVDARGSTPYFGVETNGTKLFVKVLGADERSADLLFRLYRRLLPRNFGDPRAFGSLQRTVEHEAFVALAARAVGVRTPALRAVATADPNGLVLAYAAIEGRSLDRVDPGEVTDDVLAAIWVLVRELRRHRLAHRDLRLANIFLDDGGQVWLIDFGFGEVVASDLLLATDVAELLASSSLYVGPQRAVAHAVDAVDAPTLAAALDRLRPWALSGATRTALKARAWRARRPSPAARRGRHRRRPMNPWWLLVSGAGLIVLAASIAVARRPFIGPTETGLFHAVNGLPGLLYVFLWLPMQLGNLVVGTAAGLAVALVDRDVTVAIGVILAMGLKLVTERIVRHEMADHLAVRQRPGSSQTGAILRGADVPSSGPSFPSGHVILVAAVGAVVTPVLPVGWWWVPLLLAVLVMVGRVYVGAHNPLDVTAGLGAGLLLGGTLATFVT